MNRYIIDYDKSYSSLRKATQEEIEKDTTMTFSEAKKELSQYAKRTIDSYKHLLANIKKIKKSDLD